MDASTKPLVLLVDDVEMDLRRYFRGINLTGNYSVETALSVDDALKKTIKKEINVAIIDLKMPPGSLGDLNTNFGEETGLSLAAKLIEIRPHINVILLSNSDEGKHLEPAFRDRLRIRDILLKNDTKPIDLVRSLDSIYGVRSNTPNIFIVHGHDRELVKFVQDIVEKDLGWTKPIVLDEQAGGGLTIIEKFENFAHSAEAVLVLMSPDDFGASRESIDDEQFRARQNVLFELGFFFGKFRRQSGRVFILKSGNLELPSDLAGIVYINVEKKDNESREKIVKELKYAFRPFGA